MPFVHFCGYLPYYSGTDGRYGKSEVAVGFRRDRKTAEHQSDHANNEENDSDDRDCFHWDHLQVNKKALSLSRSRGRGRGAIVYTAIRVTDSLQSE